ncbi:MAG: insulinase family protein, partial [Candidatus Eremiobacteraeota bacterium]|nr:insulinase family protein [Candidatus Eremiobacteraeota bacterium]
AGYSHFLEHMLFRNRAAGHGISYELQALGGYLNGFTSYECTCYWSVFSDRHFERVLEIQKQAVLEAHFGQEECRREAEVILEELKMREDDPAAFCFEQLLEVAYPEHAYGRPIIGRTEVLESVRPHHLEDFYRRFYVPENMAVVVVGGISAERVLPLVEASFGQARSAAAPGRQPGSIGAAGPRRRQLEGDIAGAHLQLAFPIPDLFSDEAFACDLLACVLGRGRSSRLHRCLRERDNHVSRIGSSLFLGREPGQFVIQAVLPKPKLESAETALWSELERVRQGDISEHELHKARNMVESSYIFGQETVEGQARKLGYYEMMGDFGLADDYVRRLWQVDLEALRAAAARFLDPAVCSTVVYAGTHD